MTRTKKKSKIISLDSYRKKRRKVRLKKKSSQMGSNEVFLIEEELPFSLKKLEKKQDVKIYYIKNDKKHTNRKMKSKDKMKNQNNNQKKNILNFLDYKTKKKSKISKEMKAENTLKFKNAKIISLNKYSNKKIKSEKNNYSTYQTIQSGFKKAISYGAVTLITVFVMSFFFNNDQEDNQRRIPSTKDPVEYSKVIPGYKTDMQYSRKNFKSGWPHSYNPESYRSLAQKIQKHRSTNKTIVFGKKPEVSNYKGF